MKLRNARVLYQKKKKKIDGFYEDVKNSYYFFMKPTKYGVFIFIF